MIVYGVNRGGKTIQVLGDFSIHIPYGYCYCINENAWNTMTPSSVRW